MTSVRCRQYSGPCEAGYGEACVEVLSINFARSLPSNRCIGTENITALVNAVNFNLEKRLALLGASLFAKNYFTVKAQSEPFSLAWNYAYKMDCEFFAFYRAKSYSTVRKRRIGHQAKRLRKGSFRVALDSNRVFYLRPVHFNDYVEFVAGQAQVFGHAKYFQQF